MKIITVKSAASTNDLLKALMENEYVEEGAVISTEEQTAGKGQRGNSWESEAGKNLTFSILFYPTFLPLSKQFLLSKAVALGVRDALSDYLEDVRIKWPNDIYHGSGKLAGILIENTLKGNEYAAAIAGIGLNVNQEKFVSNAPNPLSMKQITGSDYPLDILLDQIVGAIMNRYEALKGGVEEEISTQYFDALYRNNGFYPYLDSERFFKAKIVSVENSGIMRLETGSGEIRDYSFKEVEYV
jgi:BirA family biotin operon repressor/biotin-[acetyl-CoA-carboxylase] ligase